MSEQIIRLTTEIVSGYVANNHHKPEELPDLIKSVFDALAQADAPAAAPTTVEIAKPTAAAIKKSIADEYLVSFEDGKHYKMLRRHLAIRGLRPDEYRAKYGLAKDYPMTAPAYSAMRSELARSSGLGQQRRDDHRAEPVEAAAKMAPSPDEGAQDDARSEAAPGGGKTRKAATSGQPSDRGTAPKKRASRTAKAA